MRIAVLASGGGTNLQVLLDTVHGRETCSVALVAGNRPDAGAFDRARRHDIPTAVFDDPDDGPSMLDALARHRIDAVILAGYLKRVPEDVTAAFPERMVNIHPALLPAFGGPGMYGRHVHRAVLASGATVSGATVHLVSPEYDRGQILAQWPVPVHRHDTPDSLAARVLHVEHALLPAVVRNADPDGRFRSLPIPAERFTAGNGQSLTPATLVAD